MSNQSKQRQRQKRGIEAERKVLEAASNLMREGGFEATNIASIAGRSGVSTGSIYHHFGSKDGVLQRMIEVFCAEGRARLDGIDTANLDFDSTLRVFTDATVHQFHQNPELYRTMASRVKTEPELWQPLRELRFYYERAFVAAVEQNAPGSDRAVLEDGIHYAMQVILAVLTHTIVFQSGPILLHQDSTSDDIFALAQATFQTRDPN